jgi:hypothetical protein
MVQKKREGEEYWNQMPDIGRIHFTKIIYRQLDA